MIYKQRHISFNYDDIKYDFIPFIENFNNKYGIKDYIKFDNYLPVTLNKNIFISEFKLYEILNEKDFYGSPISGYLTCITFKLKPFER